MEHGEDPGEPQGESPRFNIKGGQIEENIRIKQRCVCFFGCSFFVAIPIEAFFLEKDRLFSKFRILSDWANIDCS